MSIHFAAARTAARSPVARALARKAVKRAANDNPGGESDLAADPILHAALRHFGEHGLGAAVEAATQAERAWRAGESEAYQYWTEVCRKLDRRVADDLVMRTSLQDVG